MKMTSIEIATWIMAVANVVIAICAVLALRKFSGNRADNGSNIAQGKGNTISTTNQGR